MNSTLQHALEVHYIKLHFTLEMEEDVILPENKGSALRGGIGEMLLRANCIQNRECEKCHFSSECIIQHTLYSKFEKKPSFVTTGESIGYVIECEDYRNKFTAGDTLKFQLLLLGKTVVYFNLFLQAIHTLGMNGLGTNAGHFHILHIVLALIFPIQNSLQLFLCFIYVHFCFSRLSRLRLAFLLSFFILFCRMLSLAE